mgnify:CR=1 FL=1
MKPISLKRGPRNDGMVMMATVFLLLVLLPISLVFVRWVSLHRKGTTRTRAHIKGYYAGISSANIARYRIQNDPAFRWGPAIGDTTIDIGDGTSVTVETQCLSTP